MNQYITGSFIKELREKNKMTQTELANILNVSDKTVSKWETGKGLPDISLIEPIANAFSISVAELFSGNYVENRNVSANVKRGNFYVCPICGNILFSVGDASISCHGILLPPLSSSGQQKNHRADISFADDEIFVFIDHPMTKSHSITFIAAISCDRVQIVKLYPESNAEARFKRDMVEKIYFFCNKDGLFESEL